MWNDGSIFAEPVERAADRGGLGIVLPDAAERGADDPAARVDAEYGADVRGSGAGCEQRGEFVGVDPQRERDALPGGLPPDLAVVVAVQSPGFAAVLETECEGLPVAVAVEEEGRKRIGRLVRGVPPPLAFGQGVHPGVAHDAGSDLLPLFGIVAVADLKDQR